MQSLFKKLNLNYPIIMGILNITHDSFFDGGRYNNINSAMNRVKKMIKQGAEIIDVGGESTNPFSKKITLQKELDRVIPIIEKINNTFKTYISIDTSKPEVMLEASKVGAHIINDVQSLSNSNAFKIASKTGLFVSIMHQPSHVEKKQKKDIVKKIKQYFIDKIFQCQMNGIKKDRLIIDPGFGYGKSLIENYRLLAKLNEFNDLNVPILIGISRKSMIGKVLNVLPKDRLIGSIACATIATLKKVKIIRTHDVKETMQAIKIAKMTVLAKEKVLYKI